MSDVVERQRIAFRLDQKEIDFIERFRPKGGSLTDALKVCLHTMQIILEEEKKAKTN